MTTKVDVPTRTEIAGLFVRWVQAGSSRATERALEEQLAAAFNVRKCSIRLPYEGPDAIAVRRRQDNYLAQTRTAHC